MPEIKPIRNYPFRGKIYTAKQIDEIISSVEPDLSDYYDKSEVDALIDTKQDVLTAGDNISIVDNIISAIVSGNDYIKLTEVTISELKNKNEDYDSIYLLIGNKDNRKQMFLAHKDTYFIDINPIMGDFICKQTTLGYADSNTYFNVANIYGGGSVSLRNSYMKLTTISGTDIDASNIDTYYDSTNNVFTTDIIYRYKDQITASSCILPKNESQFKACCEYGFYTTTATTIYNAIKNGSQYNTNIDLGSRLQKNIYYITDIVKIYKLEFPTTN